MKFKIGDKVIVSKPLLFSDPRSGCTGIVVYSGITVGVKFDSGIEYFFNEELELAVAPNAAPVLLPVPSAIIHKVRAPAVTTPSEYFCTSTYNPYKEYDDKFGDW